MSPFSNYYEELNVDFDYPFPTGKFPFTPYEYGLRIMELRERENISQAQLGQLVGISAQAISKIELGKTNIDLGHTKEFSKIFNCTPHFLLGYTNNPDEVSVDGVKQKVAMTLIEESSVCTLNLLLLRVRADPELFSIFSDIFECSKKKREQIKSILKILLD